MPFFRCKQKRYILCYLELCTVVLFKVYSYIQTIIWLLYQIFLQYVLQVLYAGRARRQQEVDDANVAISMVIRFSSLIHELWPFLKGTANPYSWKVKEIRIWPLNKNSALMKIWLAEIVVAAEEFFGHFSDTSPLIHNNTQLAPCYRIHSHLNT